MIEGIKELAIAMELADSRSLEDLIMVSACVLERNALPDGYDFGAAMESFYSQRLSPKLLSARLERDGERLLLDALVKIAVRHPPNETAIWAIGKAHPLAALQAVAEVISALIPGSTLPAGFTRNILISIDNSISFTPHAPGAVSGETISKIRSFVEQASRSGESELKELAERAIAEMKPFHG